MNGEESLADLTLASLAPRIRSRELSPVELTGLLLSRIERLNPAVNAYVTVAANQALEAARKAEEEIANGRYRGPLHGIPFSIKDNLATMGVRTTAGSKILAAWQPDHDATVVTRLKNAGAIILGKTNMHEWALGGTTINPFFGTTRNPWDLTRIAGGSSGGSAAAVASGLCAASIGTDSAQSVRNPAAMCGIVGLKPTYGRISQFGMVPGTGAYSTNCIGILANTVEDCALVLEAVSGYDARDPLSAEEPVPAFPRHIGLDVRGRRVGLLRGFFEAVVTDEVNAALSEAVAVFRSLGMETEEVSIPHMDLLPAVKVCTSRSENVTAHIPYLKTRLRDYSPAVLYDYISALLIPAATYVTAQRVRRLICDEFSDALRRVDVMVCPTVPFPAPTIEECQQEFVEIHGRKMRRRDARGGIESLCAFPFNVTGQPALSVCCGFSSAGLPIGLQIAGAPFQEATLFQVAHAYERATAWHARRPRLAGVA